MTCAFIFFVLIIWGLMTPNGFRAAFANNLWSLKFLKSYYQPLSTSDQLQAPPNTHTHAGLLLARKSLSQGDLQSALAYLELQLQAADPYALDTYAELLYTNGQIEQACQIWADLKREQTLEQVLRQAQSAQDPQAYFYAAQALYHINPEKFTPNLAAAYSDLNQNDQALAILQQSIQTYPTSKNQALWYRYIADIYNRQGLYEQAEKAYRQSLEKDPQHVKSLRNLGLMYRSQLNQPEKALACFQEMIKLDPQDPYPYILAAQTHESLGQTDQALQLYQAVLNFDPDNEEALKSVIRLTTSN